MPSTPHETEKEKPPKRRSNPRESRYTERMAAFVDAYCTNGFAGNEAAITAGYAPKYAPQQAYRLLGTPSIQAGIRARMRKREEQSEITQQRVLKEYGRIAFADLRRLYKENGELKAIIDLDDDAAAFLSGVDVEDLMDSDAEGTPVKIGEVRKFRTHSKTGALDSIARHLGMFNDRLNLAGDITIQVVNYAKKAPDA